MLSRFSYYLLNGYIKALINLAKNASVFMLYPLVQPDKSETVPLGKVKSYLNTSETYSMNMVTITTMFHDKSLRRWPYGPSRAIWNSMGAFWGKVTL